MPNAETANADQAKAEQSSAETPEDAEIRNRSLRGVTTAAVFRRSRRSAAISWHGWETTTRDCRRAMSSKPERRLRLDQVQAISRRVFLEGDDSHDLAHGEVHDANHPGSVSKGSQGIRARGDIHPPAVASGNGPPG